MSNLPKIQDLYSDKLATVRNDQFMTLLNQPPKAEWVKENKYANNAKYLPIERIEWLLKSIFKRYRIEITGQGQSFNGVWVTVRLHYFNPAMNEWDFFDGIGAAQIQTKSGASPADLAAISNNAITLAFPIAKTEAIKNAAKSFGKVFGSDLNRHEEINYSIDLTLLPMDRTHPNWGKVVEAIKNGTASIEQVKSKYSLTEDAENELYTIQA